jgi:hypothetical protein
MSAQASTCNGSIRGKTQGHRAKCVAARIARLRVTMVG